jgi:hypothetical protein
MRLRKENQRHASSIPSTHSLTKRNTLINGKGTSAESELANIKSGNSLNAKLLNSINAS